jgi:Flp pilus assembly protein TadD
MKPIRQHLKHLVAAGLLLAAPAAAQEADLDALLEQLADPETRNWQAVERRIANEWSKSGSPAMDLLLERGRAAIEDEAFEVAIEHLTALTDHAPGFAEGWNARATAFYRNKQYGPAISDIRRALALNPHHYGAMTGLGLILQELGYDADALTVFRAVQAIHPNLPDLDSRIEQLEKETGGTTL